MARWKQTMGWGGVAVTAMLATQPLAAQSLWLPAADPVGIARAGAGIAFGRSLEGATLNPALLPTLMDRQAAYLAVGMDLQSQQITPQSNQQVTFTDDRNRFVEALGAAWKVADRLALGLKLDQPFLRHGRLPSDAPSRYEGMALDLVVRRLEAQAGWAVSPSFSVGLSAGAAQIAYTEESPVRLQVSSSPSQPISDNNPVRGLTEVVVRQTASRVVPSFSVGFRWAMAPRWTVAGTHRSAIRGDLDLSASLVKRPAVLVANDGYSNPPDGLGGQLESVVATAVPFSGDGSICMPAMSSVGVRQRVNQILTWELDIRQVHASQLKLPTSAGAVTVDGPVSVGATRPAGRDGMGASLCAEITMTKDLVVRLGYAQDPAYWRDADLRVILNGSSTAAFSAGFGWKVWGGEVAFGYQFRQTLDKESNTLDSTWTSVGYHKTGTIVRLESQGHLFSFGFKKSF